MEQPIAAARAAAPKALPLRKTGSGSAGTGTVKSIRMGSEYGDDAVPDGSAEVTISQSSPRKQTKGPSNQPFAETKTARIHVSEEVAKSLTIGGKVRITLTPI